MGKSKRAFKEYSREQELAHENKMLKSEIRHLKQRLARMGGEDASEPKDLHPIAPDSKSESQRLKDEWRCTGSPGCDGYLEIVLFNKIDQEHYFRQCSECLHRTRSQKYNPNTVKGIIKKIK